MKSKNLFGFVFDDFLLLLLFSSLNRIFWNDAGKTTRFRLAVALVIGIYLLFSNYFIHKKVCKTTLGYILAMFLSGLLNYGLTEDILGTIMNILLVWVLFTFSVKYVDNYSFAVLINTLLVYALLFIVINDISVFSVGRLTHTISASEAVILYFSGNKFAVVYLHFLFLVLYCLKYSAEWKENYWVKGIAFLFLLYTMFLCSYMKCGTGMMGSVAMGILLLMGPKIVAFFEKPKQLVCFMFVSDLVFFGALKLMGTSLFQNILLLLKKDSTLTGRTYIYENIASIIEKHIFCGYGSSTQEVINVLGYGNAQNGLLQIALQFGLIGIIGFLFMVDSCVINSIQGAPNNYFIVIYLLTLSVCALVEICYSYNFIFGLILLFCSGMNGDLDSEEAGFEEIRNQT